MSKNVQESQKHVFGNIIAYKMGIVKKNVHVKMMMNVKGNFVRCYTDKHCLSRLFRERPTLDSKDFIATAFIPFADFIYFYKN